MTTERDNETPAGGWFSLDNAIVDHLADLGGAALKVYLVLARHANADRECWPSLSRIASLAGVHHDTAKRAIRELVASGLVETVSRCTNTGAPASNVYSLLCLTPREGRGLDAPTPSHLEGALAPRGGCTGAPGVGALAPPRTRHREQDIENKKARAPAKADEASFRTWYLAYPRKVSKKAALKAYTKAVAEVATEHGCSKAEAQGRLLEAVTAFAGSDIGRGPPRYIPHPATWLNSGRYDDDPSAWKDSSNAQANGRPRGGVRRDSPARIR